MRILLSSDVTVRGGVDRYVLDLARALQAVGHTPMLAIEETTISGLIDAPDLLPDVPLYRIPLYCRRHQPDQLRRAAEALIAQTAPDGLHVVCGSPFSCLALRETASRRGLPFAITEQQIRGDLALSAADAAWIEASYRAAKHVIFVSEWNRSTMSRLVDLGNVAHTVVHNGVDVDAIAARARPRVAVGDRPVSLMAAARFSPEKCLDVLIRATAMVPESVVGAVNLFGEGTEREALRRLAVDLAVEHRVKLHSWAADIPAQMAKHGMFVLPSEAEGMPYALLESMAAQIPVVVSDLPCHVEALRGGALGTLVPQGDSAALAAALRQRVHDPHGTALMAQQAQDHAKARYDVAEQMRRTLALWPIM